MYVLRSTNERRVKKSEEDIKRKHQKKKLLHLHTTKDQILKTPIFF